MKPRHVSEEQANDHNSKESLFVLAVFASIESCS